MSSCPQCKHESLATDCFCRQCGTEIPDDGIEIFECECGAQALEQDNFCHACGAGFEGTE